MKIPAQLAKRATWNRASVLLEVVLALALFVAAATVISAGMNASVQAVQRHRLNTHATNLAISILSEMQMHTRAIENIGPEPLEVPFEDWNYKIIVAPLQESSLENDAMQSVEVVISHKNEPVVLRLTQLFRASEIAASAKNSSDFSEFVP